jgi:hypothetical protein
MKMTIQAAKPRNPFVAASLRRAAGAHRPASQRQAARRELRSELNRLRLSP